MSSTNGRTVDPEAGKLPTDSQVTAATVEVKTKGLGSEQAKSGTDNKTESSLKTSTTQSLITGKFAGSEQSAASSNKLTEPTK